LNVLGLYRFRSREIGNERKDLRSSCFVFELHDAKRFISGNTYSVCYKCNRSSQFLLFFQFCYQFAVGFINIGFAFMIIAGAEDSDRWVSYGFSLFCDEGL